MLRTVCTSTLRSTDTPFPATQPICRRSGSQLQNGSSSVGIVCSARQQQMLRMAQNENFAISAHFLIANVGKKFRKHRVHLRSVPLDYQNAGYGTLRKGPVSWTGLQKGSNAFKSSGPKMLSNNVKKSAASPAANNQPRLIAAEAAALQIPGARAPHAGALPDP